MQKARFLKIKNGLQSFIEAEDGLMKKGQRNPIVELGHLMKGLEITPAALGEKLREETEIEISPKTINNWLKGKHRPKEKPVTRALKKCFDDLKCDRRDKGEIRPIKMQSWETIQIPESLNPEEELEAEELSKILISGIKLLPERQRKVIALLFMEGKSLRQVAPQVGVSHAQVKIDRDHGLKKLEGILLSKNYKDGRLYGHVRI